MRPSDHRRYPLLNLLSHPAFVELSRHTEMRKPWAVALRLGPRVTWLFGATRSDVLGQATRMLELCGARTNAGAIRGKPESADRDGCPETTGNKKEAA